MQLSEAANSLVCLQPPRSAYVHVPFCAHRCGYCNFTLIADRDDLMGAYLDALEIELQGLTHPQPLDTLFLGGGTPTQLPVHHLQRLFQMLAEWLPLRAVADGLGEYSVEANPGDVTAARLLAMREAGVNRVSLGAQSFQATKLARLDRSHSAADIRRSVALARRHGCSVSIDLIFAAPGESLPGWRDDLEQAVALRPEHVSTYGLTIEKGTRFWGLENRGQLHEVDEGLQREMYLLAIEVLTDAGYDHYEVSNFARPGHRCQHNEAYWLGRSYLAFGPGAARFVAGRREQNHRSTTTYIRRVMQGRSPNVEVEPYEPELRARERLVFGLRMLAGVDRTAFHRETGWSIDELGGTVVERFVHGGWLEWHGDRLRLTREGLLLSDSIWPDLLVG